MGFYLVSALVFCPSSPHVDANGTKGLFPHMRACGRAAVFDSSPFERCFERGRLERDLDPAGGSQVEQSRECRIQRPRRGSGDRVPFGSHLPIS